MNRYLLVLIILITGITQAENEPSDPYRQGKEALTASRYSEAVTYLEQAAENGADDPERYYWLGVAYRHREQGVEAVRAYEMAVEADPGNASVWSLYALENMAEVLTRTDRSEASRRAYQRALIRESRAEWIEKIQTQLAELDLVTGDFIPDENTIFNARGEVIGGVGPGKMRTNRPFEIARHTEDPVKQEIYYRQAITVDPGMYQTPFNLGLALVHQQRYLAAIPWFEQSDQVWKSDQTANPAGIDKADAHAFLALCYLEVGNIEKARSHAGIAMAADRDLFWANLYDLRVKIAMKAFEAARTGLIELQRLNPEQPELLLALDELDEAVMSSPARDDRATNNDCYL